MYVHVSTSNINLFIPSSAFFHALSELRTTVSSAYDTMHIYALDLKDN